MTSWLFWFLIFWFATGGLLGVAFIGKPKKPTTPGVALVGLIVNAALILTVVLGWPR